MRTLCTHAKDLKIRNMRVIIYRIWFINKGNRFHYNSCLYNLYNLISNSLCGCSSLSSGLDYTALITDRNDCSMYEIIVYHRGQGWTPLIIRNIMQGKGDELGSWPSHIRVFCHMTLQFISLKRLSLFLEF